MLYSLTLVVLMFFGGFSSASFSVSCLFMVAVFMLEPLSFISLGGSVLMDSWSWVLSVLSILSVMMVSYAQGPYYLQAQASLFKGIISILMFALLACFSLDHILGFYIFFETSALAVFLFILGFGYQPERALASLFLIMFTLASSLPLFSLLLIMWQDFGLNTFSQLWFASGNHSVGGVFSAMLMIGFLVKFPVYFFHIWLPKAHVEASSGGSMVLAGILLKLGGYGMTRMLPLLSISNMPVFASYFALVGGAVVSILCVRLVDLKVLVAYSSVAHMSLVITALLGQSISGNTGALFMSFAHGLASSALFFGVGVLYSLSGSRLFFFNGGTMLWSPWFAFFWFIFCAFNMGMPPTFNFWSEILMVLSITGQFSYLWGPLAICLFLAVVFSMILFLSSYSYKPSYVASHNLSISSKSLMIFFLHFVLLLYAGGLLMFV